MTGDVTREEFGARVGVLENEVEGDKLVTRHILEQTRPNSDDLAAIKTRLDRVEGKVDEVAQGVRGVKATVDGLIRSLPKMLSDAVRGTSRKRST